MKVSEYLPLYGLMFNFNEYQFVIDDKNITVNELFENYPDFELTDEYLKWLPLFDLWSLQKILKDNCITETNVIPYLRDLFDNYRELGGDPFEWLLITFESVNLNPKNYRKDIITIIEKVLIEWIEIFKKQPIDYLYLNTNPPQPIIEQTKLKIDQIALKYAYEGLQITRENGDNIAKEYGWKSGEKLFQRFTHFSSPANRKGKPNLCTPKKLDNKIKLIESIIELLPTDKQERAKDEVLMLKKIYEAEYQ
jgi:hypothetical protein